MKSFFLGIPNHPPGTHYVTEKQDLRKGGVGNECDEADAVENWKEVNRIPEP